MLVDVWRDLGTGAVRDRAGRIATQGKKTGAHYVETLGIHNLSDKW